MPSRKIVVLARASRPSKANGSLAKDSLRGFFQTYALESLFALALVLTILIGGYANHPGVHVAGVTLLLDLLLWKLRARLFRGRTLRAILLPAALHLLALYAILFTKDNFELWTIGLEGMFLILLVGLDVAGAITR